MKGSLKLVLVAHASIIADEPAIGFGDAAH